MAELNLKWRAQKCRRCHHLLWVSKCLIDWWCLLGWSTWQWPKLRTKWIFFSVDLWYKNTHAILNMTVIFNEVGSKWHNIKILVGGIVQCDQCNYLDEYWMYMIFGFLLYPMWSTYKNIESIWIVHYFTANDTQLEEVISQLEEVISVDDWPCVFPPINRSIHKIQWRKFTTTKLFW